MATTSKTTDNPQPPNTDNSSPTRPLHGYSLLDFPDIAREWHPTRNESHTPDKISNCSRQLVWWQCSIDSSHVWQSKPYTRTTKSKGDCPYCRYSLNKWFPSKTIEKALIVRRKIFYNNNVPHFQLTILLAIIDHNLRSKGHFIPSSTIRQISKHNHSTINVSILHHYRRVLKQQLPIQTHNYLLNFVTGVFSREVVEKLVSIGLSPTRVLTTSVNVVTILQHSKYFPRDYELVAWGCVLLSMKLYKPDVPDRELLQSMCESTQLLKVLATKYRLIDKFKEYFEVKELNLQLFQLHPDND